MKNPGNSAVVAIFVRVPVPGRVKNRLVSDLGDEGVKLLSAGSCRRFSSIGAVLRGNRPIATCNRTSLQNLYNNRTHLNAKFMPIRIASIEMGAAGTHRLCPIRCGGLRCESLLLLP